MISFLSYRISHLALFLSLSLPLCLLTKLNKALRPYILQYIIQFTVYSTKSISKNRQLKFYRSLHLIDCILFLSWNIKLNLNNHCSVLYVFWIIWFGIWCIFFVDGDDRIEQENENQLRHVEFRNCTQSNMVYECVFDRKFNFKSRRFTGFIR